MKNFDYLLEKQRMLKFLTGPEHIYKCSDCSDACPLFYSRNGAGLSCIQLELKAPEIATAIVCKWSEEHPKKTRLDYLLERFPDAVMHTDPGDTVDLRYPQVCAKALGIKGVDCNEHNNCYECWNTSIG